MNRIPRKNYALKAFTLLEIMLVVAIISLLLGVAIYNLTGAKRSAEFVAAETDIQTIATQLSTYEINAQRLPTNEQGLDALVNRPSSGPEPKRWVRLMKKLSHDPWGNKYRYQAPGKHNSDSFDLYSVGPDGEEHTEDDVTNWDAGGS